MCDDCAHKNVCRLKTEFESLQKKIANVVPDWSLQYYDVIIKCKNFDKAIARPRGDLNGLE